MTSGEPVPVDLTDDERRFLRAALLEWGGSAGPTDQIAVAMGFTDAATLWRDAGGLWKRIAKHGALTPADWKRVLLAVEVVFASDVVGSGVDWSAVSGFTDVESIRLLRGLQRKLVRCRA